MSVEEVRFGLVGYGAWGARHAAAIEKTPAGTLAAIAAPSPESRARAEKDHPDVETYADFHGLVALEELDAIVVATPNHLHAAVVRAALQAGKHVLAEKPLANSLEEARALEELARQKERLLFVGFELRFSDLWGGVKRIVDEGEIGDPRYLLVELWRRPYRQGAGGWRYDINRVGDWILEEPVHFFDLARWYLEKLGNPVSIYARASSVQPDHPELQDNFSAILRFPQGAYAVITHTLAAFEHHQTVKVSGSRGSVWASWSGATDRDSHPTSSLRVSKGEEVTAIELKRPTGELADLEDEIARVVEAIQLGAPPAASGVDGVWSVALCEAAQESIRRGAEVSLEALGF